MKETEIYAGLIVCIALGGLLTIIIHKLTEHKPKYIIDIDESLPLYIEYLDEKSPFIIYHHMIDDKFAKAYYYPSKTAIDGELKREYMDYKYMSIGVGREESEILSFEDWANTYICGEGKRYRALRPPMLKMPCPMFYGKALDMYNDLYIVNQLVKARYPQYFKS